MLRILIVSHMFASSVDPDDVFIYNQVKALADLGIEVRVLQPVPWVPWLLRGRRKWQHYYLVSKAGPWGGINVDRFVYPDPPIALLKFLSPVGLVFPLLCAIRRANRTFDFQIIHAHALTPDGFASIIAGHILKLPVIVSARGSDVHTYPYQGALAMRTARFVISRCDRLIAVSQKLARQANDLVKRRDIVEVVYNGVNSELFAPCADKTAVRNSLGIPPNGIVVLILGALIREKGIEEMIKAFERIGRQDPETILIAVGGGPMRAELEALGERLGGVGRVLLPGVISNERVAEYMRASDVLVHPSHAEGLPNAVLEAMASGLPVIATTVGGIPEVVVHGETGLLVGAMNSDALEKALRIVLNDREKASQMGICGLNRVKSQHTWEKNAKEHIRIYRELLENR